MEKIALIGGRVLLAIMFVMAGANKLMNSAQTAEFIESASPLPGILALPTGLYEVAAGLLLALGKFERINAPLLAGFTILTILFFHTEISDPTQMAMALKNLAVAGGLLVLFAHSE